MPFVDAYKQEQIKKVIEKHRSRHHSGPDSKSCTNKSAKHRDTHSMPILWQSVYAGQRPRFLSMPTLDNSRISLHTANINTRYPTQHQRSSNTSNKSQKHSLFSSIKKLFTNKKSDTSSKTGLPGANAHRDHSQSFTVPSKNKKLVDSDVAMNGCSPKRQRIRTISNLSGVMETIEEVNEVLASTDHLTDSDSDDDSSYSGNTIRSVTSAPELTSNNNLLYSCGNLSSFSDSSSSHHGGSSDLICAA